MDVDGDEEEARAVHVRITQQPAGVDVAHDQLVDAVEGAVGGRIIMHRQHDAGDDLDGQEDAGGEAEVPPVIKVARHRVPATDGAVDDARKRQALVEPFHHRMLGFVGLGPLEAHFSFCPLAPIVTVVGDVKS